MDEPEPAEHQEEREGDQRHADEVRELVPRVAVVGGVADELLFQ